MIYPFKQTVTLPNGAKISVRGELKIHFTKGGPLNEIVPDYDPAEVNEEYDTEILNFAADPGGHARERFENLLRAQVNKWAARHRSTQEALAGYESLQTQLKVLDLSERNEIVVDATIIDIALKEEQKLEDLPLVDRIKRIITPDD